MIKVSQFKYNELQRLCEKQQQQIKELKDVIEKAKKHVEITAGSAIKMSTLYKILNKH